MPYFAIFVVQKMQLSDLMAIQADHKFENDKFIIEYYPDDETVEFLMKDGEIDKQDIVDMHNATLAMTKTRKYATLFRAMDFFSITSEARQEGSKKHYSAFVTIQAFVVKNMAQRLLGNFIMKFNSPVRETRLFSNYPDAKEWIKKRLAEIEIEEVAKSASIQ